jgi:hypothetical protein
MKPLFILFFLILSASFSLTAQVTRFQDKKAYKIQRTVIDEFRTDKFIEGGFVVKGNLKYSEIEGTPYLNDEFKKGTITTTSGSLIDNLLLRYNCYNDQIEYLKTDSVLEINPKSLILKAKFDNRAFSYVKFRSGGKYEEGFSEVLVEGKASLLCRYHIGFLPPSTGLPYGDTNKARFKQPVRYFYVSNGDNDVDLVKSKKDLIHILKDRKTELGTFISVNKLSLNKIDDLKRIIAYYNSL